METYVTDELPRLIGAHFPADLHAQGIFGHSMGGHGALTLALRHPGRYRSVSAFAPIVAPSTSARKTPRKSPAEPIEIAVVQIVGLDPQLDECAQQFGQRRGHAA